MMALFKQMNKAAQYEEVEKGGGGAAAPAIAAVHPFRQSKARVP
jgi:hypothetical protein